MTPASPATPTATGTATHPTAPHPPAPVPWWPGTGSGGSSGQSSFPQSANPWAGYLNMLQQPHFQPSQPYGEKNFHFVGSTNNFSPPSPATTPYVNERVSIDVDEDDGVEASKLVKRKYWSHEEEVKLASAWLNTSKDPIHGNDKKSDSFWGQITKDFNQNNKRDHYRDTNSLKIHWTRLSKMINEFNGYWTQVCKMNKSGFSDDQLMDEAQKRYKSKNGKPFSLVHWWKTLKNEPKWWSDYFTKRVDAIGQQGLTPLQKCTAAIRQLANGSAADHLDESLKIGETTSLEAMKHFVEGVITVFDERYLRRPTVQDTERLLKIGEKRGFPGMFGSTDCMHWQWERCPTAWKSQFTRGDQKVPTIILEAVASVGAA